ncbi:hypothetical protein FHU29_002606 [Hoyosella altamirensis]|uniref:Uncharacterized protein n=1 Tax=Hoyosella altamirensis TaxID=616997 RepID=A0A839RP55_9ACTN|nr:hypothetical protein [Hoyosella altamirensis]
MRSPARSPVLTEEEPPLHGSLRINTPFDQAACTFAQNRGTRGPAKISHSQCRLDEQWPVDLLTLSVLEPLPPQGCPEAVRVPPIPVPLLPRAHHLGSNTAAPAALATSMN